jgi:hypothetical protein
MNIVIFDEQISFVTITNISKFDFTIHSFDASDFSFRFFERTRPQSINTFKC